MEYNMSSRLIRLLLAPSRAFRDLVHVPKRTALNTDLRALTKAHEELDMKQVSAWCSSLDTNAIRQRGRDTIFALAKKYSVEAVDDGFTPPASLVPKIRERIDKKIQELL
jgi:hypothetical protein